MFSRNYIENYLFKDKSTSCGYTSFKFELVAAIMQNSMLSPMFTHKSSMYIAISIVSL